MKIYLVLVDDRHADLDVEPFLDKEEAINCARYAAHMLCSRPEDLKEEEIKGRLYHVTYSVEGDSVWVVEKELKGG